MTTRPAHAGTMLAIDALLYLIVHLLAGVHAVRASVCGRLQSERRCVLAKPALALQVLGYVSIPVRFITLLLGPTGTLAKRIPGTIREEDKIFSCH